jgi:hypothetical protein
MRGAIPQLPQHVFMAWCSVKHRDRFILGPRDLNRHVVSENYVDCFTMQYQLNAMYK